MTKFMIDEISKIPKLKSPVLIEGLPGIGNVGKIAVDFMIDELKAKKFLEICSYGFPHSVFVNDKNLVDIPSIKLYYKKGKQDLILLAGDIQPVEDQACYEFCEEILKISKKMGVKEIITLGGIGLADVPEKPKIYISGNNEEIIKKYSKGTKTDNKLYGVVGPIIGVSGVLIGMAKRSNIDAITLLAETYGHPMYLGMNGAREIIKILNNKNSIGIDMKSINKEITKIEKDISKNSEEFQLIKKQTSKNSEEENHYIG